MPSRFPQNDSVTTKTPHSIEKELRAFCDLCGWVYECWTVHHSLFEEMPKRVMEEHNMSPDEFLETPYGSCLNRLNDISIEYRLLQIAKLHDPSSQSGSENLSVDYFARQEFWSDEEREAIENLVLGMNGFYGHIKPARNKVLAHNDLSTYVEDSTLGEFPEGEDEKYFHDLGVLCTMIWSKVPKKSYEDRIRVFEFTKSGIDGDPLCPATEARELGRLIVGALPRT